MSEPLVFPAEIDTEGRIAFDTDCIPSARRLALSRARFGGKRVDVEIRHRKSRRSLEQNKWLHAAFKGWADFLGYSVDELKREVLALVFGADTVTSPLTGEERTVLCQPHTSGLSTRQFAELMDRAIIEAAQTGYVIEEPDEWKAKRRVA